MHRFAILSFVALTACAAGKKIAVTETGNQIVILMKEQGITVTVSNIHEWTVGTAAFRGHKPGTDVVLTNHRTGGQILIMAYDAGQDTPEDMANAYISELVRERLLHRYPTVSVSPDKSRAGFNYIFTSDNRAVMAATMFRKIAARHPSMVLVSGKWSTQHTDEMEAVMHNIVLSARSED